MKTRPVAPPPARVVRVHTGPRPAAAAAAPFTQTWQAADAALRAAKQASLTHRLHDTFTNQTLGSIAEVANSRVQNAAALAAEACVSAVPVVNSLPHVRELASTLARKLAGRVSSKNLISDALRQCGGTRNAVATLTLAVTAFMMHQAQAWGAHTDLDHTAYVLNQYASLTAAFVSGYDVDLSPIVHKLAPAHASLGPIWALIRSKALCAWCQQQCPQQHRQQQRRQKK